MWHTFQRSFFGPNRVYVLSTIIYIHTYIYTRGYLECSSIFAPLTYQTAFIVINSKKMEAKLAVSDIQYMLVFHSKNLSDWSLFLPSLFIYIIFNLIYLKERHNFFLFISKKCFFFENDAFVFFLAFLKCLFFFSFCWQLLLSFFALVKFWILILIFLNFSFANWTSLQTTEVLFK